MDKPRVSVDDLLARQGKLRPGIRATIKADIDDRVTVTPVVAGGACTCAHKITVNKADIKDLALTDDVSDCCGEKLIVVEVAFANETVASIFRQLSESAAGSLKNRPVRAFQHGRPTFPLPRPTYDWGNYLLCCQSCEWWATSSEDVARCYERCLQYHLSA